MTIPKINSAHGSDTRNIINRAIEVLNHLGIDVQTLVAEGQLTPEQYAELIFVIEGNLKSGDVNFSDLSKTLQKTLNDLDESLMVEKNRIDNFAKLSEGSTTGDAELIDGRVGSKGEIYSNIGEAIQRQFSITDNRLSFQDELRAFGEASMDSSFLSWEPGSFSTVGEPYSDNRRARSINFYIPQTYNLNITAKAGYEFLVVQYESDSTFIRRLVYEFTSEWEIVPGFKYRFVIKKTDNSILNDIPSDVLIINAKIENEVSRDRIVTGSYYNIDTDTLFSLSGWNAVIFPTTALKKYEYDGITNAGSTPAVAFLRDDAILSMIRLSVGKNIISIPLGTTHTAISASDEDVNNVKLIELTEISPKEVNNAFKNMNEISMNEIHSMPAAGVMMLTGVKPSQDEREDVKYSGLAFSDGVVWRWVNNSELVVSATGYATAKVSDGDLIASHQSDVVRPIASVTKVLSAVVSVDHIQNMNNNITVKNTDIRNTNVDAFVKEGEVLTGNDLLNSSLIQSDNNAAMVLARVAGHIINPHANNDEEAKDAFYEQMEELANDLGMDNTSNFIFAHDRVNSTPSDLIKLGLHVYNNYPEIMNSWGKLEYEMVSTGSSPRTWSISSTTSADARNLIPEFLGGKTGTGNYKGSYLFIWKHKVTNELYLTSILNSNIYNNERFMNPRRMIDEVYSND